MKTKYILMNFMILLMILLGCSTIVQEGRIPSPISEISTRTALPKRTITITSTPTLKSTLTSTHSYRTPNAEIEVEPTNSPSATAGPSITTGKVPICQGEGQKLPKPDNFNINGTIIFHTYDDFWGLHSFGGDPAHQSHLPVDQSESYQVLGFSPDGRWLAYFPIPLGAFERLWEREFVWEYFDLVLLSDSREKIEHKMDISILRLNLREEEFSQQGPGDNVWINDHLIYTNLMSVTKVKSEITGYYFHMPAVFDPFTGTWHQEIIEKLPDDGITEIAFSSDLTRALYYKPPNRLVLWNLSENEVLWEDNDVVGSTSSLEIKWSPDDSLAIIANREKTPGENEILLITQDGKISRMIASRYYPTHDFSPIYIEWSPDSRFIAMSHWADEVYIYDVENDRYLFMCPFTNPDNMVWSPDSRYIAMGAGFDSLRIVDIENGDVIELIPYGIPAGWSATFPTEWP